MASKNKLVVPGARSAMDNMKKEIANELGVNMGPDATARENGAVGGKMVKKLVEIGSQAMSKNKSKG